MGEKRRGSANGLPLPLLFLSESTLQKESRKDADMNYFQLLRAHQGYLERIALAMLGNRHDAEDALQEAALSGYQHFDQLRGGEHAFGAWMRRILIRQCRRVLDSRRRTFPVDDLVAYIPDTVPGPDAASTATWELVARLSDHLRPVIVMRYMLDMSQQEIAEELGIPLGTVKSRLGKALEILRKMEEEQRREAR
jgi:RNA polymerase sigma-70 factor (ECF subfamily)